MFVLYEIATGRAVSESSESPKKIKDGYAVKETDKTGIWNTVTLDFDPRTEDKRRQLGVFVSSLTDLECEALFEAAKNNKKIASFIKKAEFVNYVDLNASSVIAAITEMEDVGVIGSGRAAEVLNG